MPTSFRLFPESGSTSADEVDNLFAVLMTVTGFFTLLIFILIFVFVLKYRRRPGVPSGRVRTSYALEAAWTIIPLIIAMGLFIWGAKVYVRLFSPPANAMEIYVIGKQWMWKIQHPEGRGEINELHVPVGRPVRLVMSSQDVIHDFFIPAFRIKHDVLPGRYTSIWFKADKVGEYHFFCSQYCGTGHSGMIGTVIAMEPAAYQAWLANSPPEQTPAKAGERLYEQYGCTGCHGQQAPTLAGLYMSQVELEGGGTVIADDNYLRESILDSTAKIVKGYPPIMPSYRGQLSETQIMQLVEYIKSLKKPSPEAKKP